MTPTFDEMARALQIAKQPLEKIKARDFNCGPHQHAMAAAGRAEEALNEMHKILVRS